MFTRLELEAIAGVILVIAACLGLHFYDAHQQALGAASIRVAVQAATAKAVADDAEKAKQTDATQAANLHEATAQDAARMANARALDALAARVQHGTPRGSGSVFAAAVAAPASAASGVPPAGMVREELYFWALQRAIDASKYADCLYTGGQLCDANYRALTPPQLSNQGESRTIPQ